MNKKVHKFWLWLKEEFKSGIQKDLETIEKNAKIEKVKLVKEKFQYLDELNKMDSDSLLRRICYLLKYPPE